MVPTRNNRWLHCFALGLAVATLFLVALGGVVTTKGVGMAVPDWPTTYGHHMFFFPFSHWYAGIFDEHSHRVWASIVGILAAVFAIWAWARDTSGPERWGGIVAMLAGLALVGVRTPTMFVITAVLCAGFIAWAIPRAMRAEHCLRWLGAIMFAAVIIQGVLGGLRVVLDTHGWGKEFGIFHGILAQLFFLLVCSIALLTSKWWERNVRPGIPLVHGSKVRTGLLLTTGLIFVQLLLGATMRHQHQGLAVPDFPLAYGKVWPAIDAASVATYNSHRLEAAGENAITAFHIVVHMFHRITGCLVLVAIVGCAVAIWRATPNAALRRASLLWCAIGGAQVALGVITILSQRKVDVTTGHVALGAVTFMMGWLLVLMAKRVSESTPSLARKPAMIHDRELKHA